MQFYRQQIGDPSLLSEGLRPDLQLIPPLCQLRLEVLHQYSNHNFYVAMDCLGIGHMQAVAFLLHTLIALGTVDTNDACPQKMR